MVYIDTSALAKWYLNERRSEDFAAWIQAEPQAHISTLTVVEMRCLLARRRRNHELSIELEQRVFATLQDDIAQGFLIQNSVDDEGISGAVRLLTILTSHPLRTLDALHLSISRRLGVQRLATADRVMSAAAQAVGIDVVRFD
ncbi:MAG: type II toxin-antitoxin system VapC family toxin [Gammaproteobacteria bacterium]